VVDRVTRERVMLDRLPLILESRRLPSAHRSASPPPQCQGHATAAPPGIEGLSVMSISRQMQWMRPTPLPISPANGSRDQGHDHLAMRCEAATAELESKRWDTIVDEHEQPGQRVGHSALIFWHGTMTCSWTHPECHRWRAAGSSAFFGQE
jgi:hypothetical protein